MQPATNVVRRQSVAAGGYPCASTLQVGTPQASLNHKPVKLELEASSCPEASALLQSVLPASRQPSPTTSEVSPEADGTSASVASTSTVATAAASPSAEHRNTLALAVKSADAIEKAQDFKQSVTALVQAGGAQSAYMAYLAQKAEEAALKGYSVRRATRTVRRTSVVKTRVTTDVRTNESRTDRECMTFVDEWIEEGAPAVTGVGIMYAKGYKSMDEFSDGTVQVNDQSSKAKAMFWANGQTFEAGPTHVHSTDNVDIDGIVAQAAARARLKTS